MKPNKFTNLFIAVIFGFSATLNASILSNSQILQSNLNSLSIHKQTSIQAHGTIAKIENSNTRTTKTTITNNSSNLNANNIFINSNLNSIVKASNLNANDSINIASLNGDINILSDKNIDQSQSNSKLKERIHFVDNKSDDTNLKATNVKSNIVSNNINLNSNEITLQASNIIANGNIQIDTTKLNLISDKDNKIGVLAFNAKGNHK